MKRYLGGRLVPNPADTSARPFNPTPMSGSCNAAADQSGASGGGSVSTIYFNNTVLLTSRGEQSYPFIVLAHELIHAYHALYGLKKDGPDEELYTTGIDKFAGEEITENKIREEAGLKQRTAYFE
jgi:hypothetical protein